MRRREHGFTMLELMIAVSMALVLSVIAVPMTATIISNSDLRSTAYGLATGMQLARMRAVNTNRATRVRNTVSGGRTFVYIDENNNSTLDQSEDKVVQILPRGMTFSSSAPSPVVSGLLGSYTLPGFTTRGMPCHPSSTCAVSTTSTYFVYLKQDRTFSQTGWAAVTVTPAGRTQVWLWDGSAWKN